VNLKYLLGTKERTKVQLDDLEVKMRSDPVYEMIQKRFGDKANTGSHDQLVEIVFGKDYLAYEVRGHTATGKIAAGKDQLDEIEEPYVQNFLIAQNLKKSINTYLDGVEREMVERDGYWWVHPSYNLATISTFRSGCRAINFQNVPKRNPDMAKRIRPLFLPNYGHHFVEVDFSQLEVRIGCPYHKDPVMIKYIMDPGTDMHGDTAMEMFFLKKEEVDKKTARDSAKNQFVFPQFYGSNYVNCCKFIWKSIRQRKFMVGEKTMFEHLASKGIMERGECVQGSDPRPGTFESHLREVERKMWFKRFSIYTSWKKSFYEDYLKAGGFRMLSGFAVNGVFGRRDVANYPIQGSSFHCLLWCLIQIDKWIRKYKMKTRIIGEIHDAGQFSVHPSELQDFLHETYKIMTKDLPKAWSWINIPLDTESDVGPVNGDWTKCEQWLEKGGIWGAKA